MAEERYWKVLSPDGAPIHGGSGTWPLPDRKNPGTAIAVEGELIPCRNGLHICKVEDLWRWAVIGAHLYEVRVLGNEIARHEDGTENSKSVCRRAQLGRLVGAITSSAHTSARAEYERVRQTAWAEYERVRQTAMAEYERVEQTAMAEYERVRQTARAEYERALPLARLAFGHQLLQELAQRTPGKAP